MFAIAIEFVQEEKTARMIGFLEILLEFPGILEQDIEL